MSLFQKVIVKKYLKNLSSDLIEENYKKYTKYFNDFERAERIRILKEEQYQEGFLRELFVDCLNYTINPNENFNLTTEFKNKTDAEKADGAILKDEKPIAVIELKSTKTKDLKTIEKQAFNYKAHQVNCKYVITSNFEKIRLYINDATEFEEFNVFQLSKDEFKFLFLCLSKESIFEDIPSIIIEKSNQHEEQISKKLYNDYSDFRNKIFQNLTKNNPQIDKLILFKKSQKLLDRFLFIFFAEDKGLIPANMISKIIDDYNKLKDMDHYTPLFSEFKRFFEYINKGNPKYNIDAYNGGLFQFDEILDNVKIDDEVLIEDSLKLSNYDFDSEVDVNILGHIFEHSLDDIENITAELSTSVINENATSVTREHVPLSHIEKAVKEVGETISLSKKKSRRKKEGVFYTPNYITKYIVENTIGALCNEKRNELKLINIEVDETYFKKTKKSISKKGEQLFDKLENYKEWLLSLKILDPACGSGAFLNQALNFLIDEHNFIIDLETDLRKDQLSVFDIDIAVLENNLYGVDINEESVEIAKLSLWLKTAKKGRKLTDLSKRIKCGNSLIDDPEIAGEKAFDWNKEFPDIFTIKDKKTWHIITATHNSRYSQRMFDNHVKLGEPVWLTENEEINITKTISEIIVEDKLNIPAYNICGDHLHMIIVCGEDELSKIVGKIKAVSARKHNIEKGITIPATNKTLSTTVATATRGHVPLSTPKSAEVKYNSLWTQKFGEKEIVTDKQLHNTLNYIRSNRKKHKLPENNKLKAIINKMTCTIDHAFRFEYNGGFDVVIGNPPYVQSHSICDSEKKYIYKNYITAEYQINTYGVFVEKFISLLKDNSFYSLIIPNYWLSTKYDKLLRKEVFINNRAIEIINTFEVFESATVDTLILTGIKSIKKVNQTNIYSISNSYNTIEQRLNAINLRIWNFSETRYFRSDADDAKISFAKKFKLSGDCILKDFFIFKKGMQPYEKGKGNPPQTREMMVSKVYHSKIKTDETYLPLLGAKHIKRHYLMPFDEYIKYGKNLAAPRKPEIFKGERILINRILSKKTIDGILLSETYINNTDVFNLIATSNKTISIKVLYALIVSKLCATYFKKANVNLNRNTFPKINVNTLETFPIPKISKSKQKIIEDLVDSIVNKTSKLYSKKSKFLGLLKDNFGFEKLTRKLSNFNHFEFKEIVSELKKQKIKISLSEQSEWKDFFESNKNEINQLQKQINSTDKEIDQMVYELYGLTKEEIEIVEGG